MRARAIRCSKAHLTRAELDGLRHRVAGRFGGQIKCEGGARRDATAGDKFAVAADALTSLRAAAHADVPKPELQASLNGYICGSCRPAATITLLYYISAGNGILCGLYLCRPETTPPSPLSPALRPTPGTRPPICHLPKALSERQRSRTPDPRTPSTKLPSGTAAALAPPIARERHQPVDDLRQCVSRVAPTACGINEPSGKKERLGSKAPTIAEIIGYDFQSIMSFTHGFSYSCRNAI